ncbi:MAG: class I adenylate-forming enzyme family protein [Pseudomonadales bacterium]
MPTMTRAKALAALTAPGQTYAIEKQMVHGEPQRVFSNAPATLRALFDEARSDATFIVFESERRTFEESWQEASIIAHILVHDYGIGCGDRVAISMRNYPEWITAFMAITSIGAIAVAMNALWTPDELEYGLANAGAKVLFADQERLDRFAQCTGAKSTQVIAVRPTNPTPHPTLAALMAAVGPVAMPDRTLDADDPVIMFFTSGSTGHPKGVVSSHRNVLTALMSWELDAHAGLMVLGEEPPELPYQSATLLAVPLFHVTGSHAVLLQCFRAQRKIVAMYKWQPDIAAELIERERITSFTAPAAMTGDLVRIAKNTARDLGSLLSVGGGGAPRAPEQVRQIGSSFTQALPNTGWGMTETNGIGTGIGGHDYLDHPASSGRVSAVLELRVVDDAGNTLQNGQRGELQIRGTSVFRGYWNRPEVNAEAFVDGWFRTGDVAHIDDEGYLYIVDRIKDLIIRGGENIGCGQVEAALLLHPEVYEAAVYAVPDERLGEEVGATVFCKPDLDFDELEGFLANHLAKFEIPRFIRRADGPLPRTASGKILKRELRAEAVEALGRTT